MKKARALKESTGTDVAEFRAAALVWYDAHRRDLPWRAAPGQAAEPYRTWLSEVMLQQTTVQTVIPYFRRFTGRWPTVADLARAPLEEVLKEWAGLGYYARARNLHKCAVVVAEKYGGVFPDSARELKKLPGIGEYTSSAIAAIAFDKPASVVDGNVERVMARFFALREPMPRAKSTIRERAETLAGGQSHRPGDYAQALMDIGATVCRSRNPLCQACPLAEGCGVYVKGKDPEAFPAKAKARAKPVRRGYVYWVENASGEILVIRREPRGLLGGMLALPCSAWEQEAPEHPSWVPPDIAAGTQPRKVEVRHIFTHFELRLTGFRVRCADTQRLDLPDGLWMPAAAVTEAGLPSLFKKAARLFVSGP